MSNLIDNLLSVKIFEGFTRRELSEILPFLSAHYFNVKKNTVFIESGQRVDTIVLVLEGEFAVSKEDIWGNSNLMIKIGPREILTAETACTPSKISPVKIRCIRDAYLMSFPYALLASKSPLPAEYRCTILKNILDIVSNSHARQLYKIELLSTKGLRDRIMLYLAFQSKRSSGNSFRIPFNREELATYLCVDRSALSRELGRMQKDGLIRFNKNHFTILSPWSL